jgi:kumamolisin
MPSIRPLGNFYRHQWQRGKWDKGPYGRIFAIVAPLCALVLIVGVAILQMFSHLSTTQAMGPTLVPGALSPRLMHSSLRGHAAPQQHVTISIGLRPRNQAGLNGYVHDIMQPRSVNFHRFLSPAQFNAAFAPGKNDYDAVLHYLRAAGFTILSTYNHRLLITVNGTVAQAEQAFNVTINNYIAPDGRVYYANDREPALPASLARSVVSIVGLNDAVHWHHPQMYARDPHVHLNAVQQSHTAHAAPAACPKYGSNYLLPNQVASAYNLQSLYNDHIQGEGQTIALFELDSFITSDLTTYSACFGHGHTTIQTVPVGNTLFTSDAGMLEVELDAELILSTAPRLGTLRIYETTNDAGDVLGQWAQIVQDAIPVVSTSWGLCEQFTDANIIRQENILFTAAAAQGQGIFAASGDSGSEGCEFDDISKPIQLVTADPSSQPLVTSIGGTRLTMNGTSRVDEVAWNSPPNPLKNYGGGASGGGLSQIWGAPDWQKAPGVLNSYNTGKQCNASSGCRATPDVSLHADPTEGFIVYCTAVDAGCNPARPWTTIGGTSASTPIWTAWAAMVNEMSLRQGGFNLGFLNPMLYRLANNPGAYKNDFFDITQGNNDFNKANNGTYPAGPGYDMATGLGSFNAANLAKDLVALAQSAKGTRASTSSNTWYFAEGCVGGGFQEFITMNNPDPAKDAHVAITYLFPTKAPVVINHTINRSSRTTVNVNQDLGVSVKGPQQSISAIVSVQNGGSGIVAERPMYFTYKGIKSGTDVIGATSTSKTFYFSEADTRKGGRTYHTYVTMLNPSSSQRATATLTYYTGHCGLQNQPGCPKQRIVIPPLHRATGSPDALSIHQRSSISIQVDQPIVAERALYMQDTIPTAGGFTTGAATQVGAQSPAKDWLFAEGYTGDNFQEYLVLANFDTAPADATITLQHDDGSTQSVHITVPALGQSYFDVNQAKATQAGSCSSTPCQATDSASAEVKSSSPIVADRLTCFHYGNGKYSGITDTIGEVGPASHNVYSFAEGYTTNNFHEYLTLQNPTSQDETAAITLFANTYIIQRQIQLKAHSHMTININTWLIPIVQSHLNLGLDSYAVAMTVQALGSGAAIVAERPIYFNYHGAQGGTDTLGYAG